MPSQIAAEVAVLLAGSQTGAPHRAPGTRKVSMGQAAGVPLQVSAASQTPAAARHTVVAGWRASAGQAVLPPLQVSATSQGPAAARHRAPALAARWLQAPAWQASLLQGLPSSAQAVPSGL